MKPSYKIAKTNAYRLRLNPPQPALVSQPVAALKIDQVTHNRAEGVKELEIGSLLAELQRAYALSESQRQLAYNILENLPGAVIVTQGSQHQIIVANQRVQNWLGFDLIGLKWSDFASKLRENFISSGDSEGIAERAYQSGLPQTLKELEYLLPNGNRVFWDVHIYPLRNNLNQVDGLMVYSVATTDLVLLQRQAEQVIRQKQILLLQVDDQRRIFNSLVESISDGLFLVSEDERIIYANQTMATLLGIDVQTVVGHNANLLLQKIVRGSLNSHELKARLDEAMVQPATSSLIEFTYLQPDPATEANQSRDLQLSFFNVTDERGHSIGRGHLIRDVTREKEVDRLKTQFISTVSHEMRTPLSGIYGYAELLLHRPPLPEVQKQWLGKIHTEALHLTQIIDELLDLSRIEMGRLELRKTHIQLVELAQEVLATFKHVNQAEPVESVTKHQFKLEAQAELPPIYADSDRVTQVLNNLVSNALKYSPAGGLILVKLEQMKTGVSNSTSQPEILVKVSDQGLGIAPEDQLRIFERFYRTRNIQELKIRGTGLGLAIVKALVELHQGRVWLESQLGKGTSFYFTLPFSSQ